MLRRSGMAGGPERLPSGSPARLLPRCNVSHRRPASTSIPSHRAIPSRSQPG